MQVSGERGGGGKRDRCVTYIKYPDICRPLRDPPPDRVIPVPRPPSPGAAIQLSCTILPPLLPPRGRRNSPGGASVSRPGCPVSPPSLLFPARPLQSRDQPRQHRANARHRAPARRLVGARRRGLAPGGRGLASRGRRRVPGCVRRRRRRRGGRVARRRGFGGGGGFGGGRGLGRGGGAGDAVAGGLLGEGDADGAAELVGELDRRCEKGVGSARVGVCVGYERGMGSMMTVAVWECREGGETYRPGQLGRSW